MTSKGDFIKEQVIAHLCGEIKMVTGVNIDFFIQYSTYISLPRHVP